LQLVTNYGYLGLDIYFIIDTLGVLLPSKSEKLLKAGEWFCKYGAPFIVFAYFIPGMSHVTPYLCGISRLSFLKVLFFSTIGAFLWVVTFTYIGRLHRKTGDKISYDKGGAKMRIGVCARIIQK